MADNASIQLDDSTPVINNSSTTPKHPAGNNFGLAQAYILRNLAQREAVELAAMKVEGKDRILRATAISQLVKAWESASDRVRIMRGRPLPGSLRPEHKPKKTKQAPITPEE